MRKTFTNGINGSIFKLAERNFLLEKYSEVFMEKQVAQLLNEQINKELYSAYLYLSAADFYDDKGLKGFANWFEVQAREEQDHAMMIYRYLHDNDERVVLGSIAKPDKTFKTLVDPVEISYGHEMYITVQINAVYAAAQKADDYRTTQFLDWFVREQGEEEKNARDLLNAVKMLDGDMRSMFMLNGELQHRTYHEPSK
jgi:Ferritin-like protein